MLEWLCIYERKLTAASEYKPSDGWTRLEPMTDAGFYQARYQANWELVTLWMNLIVMPV